MESAEKHTAEIVGGLDIKDVAEGGTVFEVKYIEENAESSKAEAECAELLQTYLKLECLDSGHGDNYSGVEPFDALAKDMFNVLANGKIKKKIVKEGYGGTPQRKTIVSIHYNGYVQYEAQPFDSTYARKQPFTFKVGEGELIEGLEIAVLSMKINEKSMFLIDPELAFRSGGLDRIPPDSVVLFEVHLCGFKQNIENDTEIDPRSFEVVYPKCLALCVQGKRKFRLKDYDSAIKVYKEAANALEDAHLKDYNDQEKSEELLVRLYTNLLICATHAEIPKLGCYWAQKIYEMAKNETFQVAAKVYFNHAKCQRLLGGFDHANRLLTKAQNLEPNCPEIKAEFITIRKAKAEYRKQEKNFAKASLR